MEKREILKPGMSENATIVWAATLGYACLCPFWLLPAGQQLANQLVYLGAKANHPTSCLLAEKKAPMLISLQ